MKVTLVIMCLAGVCFWQFRKLKVFVGHHDINYPVKILNYFDCFDARVLIKSKINVKVTFSRGH